MNKPKRILIAPLDWGLGHTSRCVPIIRYIQSQGHEPLVAGNEAQLSFIKDTFGDIATIYLEGYNIRYSAWNKWAQIGLLSQVPGIVKTIDSEHKWLQELVARQQIDGIISDNRYGLYHPHKPSAILTHQLQLQTAMGAIADGIVQRLHYRYLKKFDKIWIPDLPGTPCLSGKLGHTDHMPKQADYIGLLSRFNNIAANNNDGSLAILLSGPEPQRSVLSGILWQQVKTYNSRVTFIEGSNTAAKPDQIPSHVTYHKRLTDKDLSPILTNAGMVICRSGYSTLMDLVATGKKAILIPTPGQTEQEYLGRYLHDTGIFYSTPQDNFNLEQALANAHTFPYYLPAFSEYYGLYGAVVQEWLNTL